jgi:hypothetical protein
VLAKVVKYDVPFIFSAFSTTTKKIEKIILFSPIGFDTKDYDTYLKKYGLDIKPGESVVSIGEAAKQEIRAISESVPAEIKIIEINE